MAENILTVTDREEFRAWLKDNGTREKECYLCLKRGRPKEDGCFYYIDAVEEALCFGWIDSTLCLADGVRLQRFSPRAEKSAWTELNKARVRRLEALGLMTDRGRAVLPDMSFSVRPDIREDLENAGVWEIFLGFPPLYQRVRAYNLGFIKTNDPENYEKALKNFVDKTKEGRLYGQWNDYGRLSSER